MSTLKPQDILVLLKVHLWAKSEWTYNQLALSLDMSASEVHAATTRADISRLYDKESKKVRTQALQEFLVHGLRYVFPGQPGAISRGIPTAHSAEPLKSMLVVDSADVYVWPTATGVERGQGIEPLYRSVPSAALKDKALYELLSLLDALRVGRVREQRLAATELSQRLRTK